MEKSDVSSDQVIAELIEMGFEFSLVLEAVQSVGSSIESAVEYILNASHRAKNVCSSDSICSTSNKRTSEKLVSPTLNSSGRMRQSSIKDHLHSSSKAKRIKTQDAFDTSVLYCDDSFTPTEEKISPLIIKDINPRMRKAEEIGSHWEEVTKILHKHFGLSSLKSFQMEALEAWLANQDCLVLAATGSGKSLCFQIPALLTGKVVVVISPLISLMHDQCLKLASHGVSACFLGSGQSDNSVEQKAMNGIYDIIYVCPETILRLIGPFQRLAENRGIALFAIDEVHCVSKWGHDFRPDYRRLSILRETFRVCNLKFLEFDIPLMALTATATIRVREDIIKSLQMSEERKIVITSFFRPNLRFSVKHSITSSVLSYEKDFSELVNYYKTKRAISNKEPILQDLDIVSDYSSSSDSDEISRSDGDNIYADDEENNSGLRSENGEAALQENEMSVEYLEDDYNISQNVDDFGVSCGEFFGKSSIQKDVAEESKSVEPLLKPKGRLKPVQGSLDKGPTIIYVPTRKETIQLSKHLSKLGVRAAAYNAKLPKAHLRTVHKEFHQNDLEVIVSTIAFGMGIDKSNVRRIIHYGWPQSLEAYYQEAGRAGRDGKLADCILYANLSRIPTLLPNKRSEEQTKQAYKMLFDCFRYGMGTACCRARTLVEYFGEDFNDKSCLLCDVCVNGPPKLQNVKVEADIFIRVITSHYVQSNYVDCSYGATISRQRLVEKLDFKVVVSQIREQFPQFVASDRLWWQGLARILQVKGYIREGGDMVRVCIKFPEPTELGLRYLQSETESIFNVHPEADMLLSNSTPKSFSTFSEWGRGWADPEIRRQRLQARKSRRKPRQKRSRQSPRVHETVRGRLAAKITKQKP